MSDRLHGYGLDIEIFEQFSFYIVFSKFIIQAEIEPMTEIIH